MGVTPHDQGGGASRSTDPAAGTSSATDISLREYFEALRHADDKVDLWIYRFYDERDRRYTEVKNAEEKALKIKEEADKRALDLQAETQTYKDEKANELRSQIERERGSYVTQTELKPLTDYVARQQGRSAGIGSTSAAIYAVALVIINVAALYYVAHH
jgi:vacuolar-type H+-ATPase subunit H